MVDGWIFPSESISFFQCCRSKLDYFGWDLVDRWLSWSCILSMWWANDASNLSTKHFSSFPFGYHCNSGSNCACSRWWMMLLLAVVHRLDRRSVWDRQLLAPSTSTSSTVPYLWWWIASVEKEQLAKNKLTIIKSKVIEPILLKRLGAGGREAERKPSHSHQIYIQ